MSANASSHTPVPAHATTTAAVPAYLRGATSLHYPLVWLLGVPLTVVFSLAGIVASLGGSDAALAHRLARAWARLLLRLIGVRLRVHGLESLQSTRGGILIANHQSALDIPALLAVLPPPVRFLAAAGLFRIPFMGWYMSRVGYVPVDRHDPRRAREALQRARSRAGDGVSILVFPEGTRTPEGTLVEFKRGSFHLARDSGLAIYPVALRNSGRLMPRGSWRVDPGTIEVLIGAPLAPDEAPSAHALSLQARARIAALLNGPSPEA